MEILSNSNRVDIKNIVSLGDDLIKVLSNQNDVSSLSQSLEGLKTLHSSCLADSQKVQDLLQDYKKKSDACKERMERVKSETLDDEQLESLQQELEGKLEHERALLQELSDEIDDLEHQRTSIEERIEIIRKRDKETLKAQDLLSMCASVTNIIPNLDDQPRISGYIVDKNRRKAHMFEFDPSVSSFEVCSRLWERM